MTDWHDHPAYWQIVSDERKYTGLSECNGPYCGLTCFVLTAILLSPILWFCYECFTK